MRRLLNWLLSLFAGEHRSYRCDACSKIVSRRKGKATVDVRRRPGIYLRCPSCQSVAEAAADYTRMRQEAAALKAHTIVIDDLTTPAAKKLREKIANAYQTVRKAERDHSMAKNFEHIYGEKAAK